jgi:hypothetical protein
MIDTIALTLVGNYKITDYEAFTPSARDLFEYPYRKWGKEVVQKSIQNPSKQDIDYKPKLTISKRKIMGSFPSLRIELSLPKLMYGNNFVELTNRNFPLLIDYCQNSLSYMGVSVSSEQLKNSKVSVIHYSKNIIIEQGLSCPMVIREINKSQINAKLDNCVTKFRNGGHALTFHSNSYEVVFYDKIKDIEQAFISPKRAIEKDHFQPDLFGRNFSYSPQVLRMEVRLGNSRKIKDILNKIKIETELTFKYLFDENTSRAVLNYYWTLIQKNMPPIIDYNANAAESIFMASPHKKVNKKLEQLGYTILRQELGKNAVRGLLSAHSDKRTAARLIKQNEHIQGTQNIYSILNSITQALTDYKPLTQADFNRMFN